MAGVDERRWLGETNWSRAKSRDDREKVCTPRACANINGGSHVAMQRFNLAESKLFTAGMSLALIAFVSACSGSSGTTDPTTATPGSKSASSAVPNAASTQTNATAPGIVLEGFGLTVAPQGGTPQAIKFGAIEDQTIAAVSSVLGKPGQYETNSDCPSGPVQFATWNKGLSANFQDGKFVGWSGAVDLKTARGIGFGSTKADLVKAYHPTFEQTSLGTEFTADGITGVMESASANAAISDLWSGMSCVAR